MACAGKKDLSSEIMETMGSEAGLYENVEIPPPVPELPLPEKTSESKKKMDSVTGKPENKIPEPFQNSIGMHFVWIPPGHFSMGASSEDPYGNDNEIIRYVTLSKGFFMMTTEVSQSQWKMVMGDNPSGFRRCGDDCPVERVSWDAVQEFIKKLQALDSSLIYRLPTEAEWEYAARGGSDGPFAFGSCLGTDQANYNGTQPLEGCEAGIYRKGPVPVGRFEANAFGLYDMHGNVWEWCQDVYAPYGSGQKVKDPLYEGPGYERVIRGGSWYGSEASCRSAGRGRYAPDRGFNSIGFRLVGDLP